MNRVTRRTWLMALFIILLLGGTSMFLLEYAVKAGDWVLAPGSPHVFNSGNIGCGTIVDESGVVLLDIGEKRAYSENATTRKSTVHWLGDRGGNISAGAIAHYAAQLSGFDLVNGLYDYSASESRCELTISARVQNAALQAMNGRRGTIGIYNYKTGEILCAVTTPTYDPDNVPDFGDGTSEEYKGVFMNRFLQASYVPGSIFKVVTTIAALETVPNIEERTFTCYGEYAYGTEKVTCETAHGKLTLKTALANSCNCSYAKIAELVGRKNMEKYVRQMMVVDPVRFDGVKSAAGNYNIDDTGAASFAWSCIGQHSDLINPARFMTFMGTLASGGRGVEPYIVSRIANSEGTAYEATPQKSGAIMKPETAQKVIEYMRNNVANGYGDYNFPGMHVCAKSGTSQLGGDAKSNAMFAGFVADEEYPLAFIVVVENGGYGSATCVPILSKVLAECKAVLDGK